MTQRPPISTRTATRFPSPTLFRSAQVQAMAVQIGGGPAQQSPGGGVCQGNPLIRFQQQHAVRIGREGQVDLRLPERRQQLAAAEITRSEEHTSELQSLMRISYAVFCLQKTTTNSQHIR